VSTVPRVILGIDPGLAMLGYGIIEATPERLAHIEHGCVVTPATLATHERLQIIFDSVKAVRQRFGVTDVALELLFHSRNVRTAVAVAQARGVAVLAAAGGDVRVGEYTPTQVKQAVGGYGGARKRQMQEMVRMLLALPSLPAPDDAADALAIAICHARQAALQEVVARQSRTW
jgi:crossover junction endodeoxyribonuclease RuvC